MSVASDTETRTLPQPVIDPADVQAILPSLSVEDATLYASLATLALQAATWPNALPPSPLPPPLYQVGLAIATRLAVAGETIQEGSSQIVSESIGAYTYRIANPGTLDSALILTDAERKLIRPWLGQASAYDVGTGGSIVWPADWWQRNLDHPILVEVPKAA